MFIEAKDDGGGGDSWTTGAISRAKLQLNHHHQQTNIQFLLQAGCPSCRQTKCVKALSKYLRTYLLTYLLTVSAKLKRLNTLCSADNLTFRSGDHGVGSANDNTPSLSVLL